MSLGGELGGEARWTVSGPGEWPRIEAELGRTIEEVETVALAFRQRFAALDSSLIFSGELLLREALLNAVMHAFCRNSATRVRCTARAKRGNLLILVDDGGEGFDWRNALARVARMHESSGRGLEIFRTYASQVRFSERGNRVSLLRHGTGRDKSSKRMKREQV